MGAMSQTVGKKAEKNHVTQAAAAPASSAPRGGGQQRERVSFKETKGRRGANNFLKPIDENTAASYTVKINKVGQVWANPKIDYDGERPNPTPGSKPAFGKKDAFFVEMEVLESNNPACPVGYMASWVTTDRYEDAYFQDIKSFLAAACNAEPEEIDVDDWEFSYSEEQPLAEKQVKVTVGFNRSGTFTPHIWSSVDA